MTPVCMVLSAPHTSSGYETYARCTIYYKAKAIKDLGFHGQSYPLFVGEPKPLSFELLLENTVLLDELVDDCLLVAVKPAGQGAITVPLLAAAGALSVGNRGQTMITVFHY